MIVDVHGYEGGASLIYERHPGGNRRLIVDVAPADPADDDQSEAEAQAWTATVIRTGVVIRAASRDAVLAVVRAAIRGGAV